MRSIAEELRRAVKNKDYKRTDTFMGKACCEVLGYQELGKCLITKKESSKALCFSNLPDNANVLLATYPSSIEISPDAVVIEHSCRHYGTKDDCEGVISKIFYAKLGDDCRLLDDAFLRSLGLAALSIYGFGDRWHGRGDVTPVSPCAREGINVPDEISLFSRLELDTFLKEVEKSQRTIP